MRGMKLLALGVALAALWGCASPERMLRAGEDGVEEEGLSAPVLVEMLDVYGSPLSWAILPAACWDEATEAGLPLADEPLLVRRPIRRGGGSGPRRPPPLLNSRPAPDQLGYWRRLPPNQRLVEQARQLYYQRLAEARARYPNGTGYEEHHAVPKYLGGTVRGQTFRLPKPYHQAITQEFRREWPYGQQRPPTQQELMGILTRVYSKYPIPQLVGIQP
jgi:hypothetical protein